MVPVAISVAQMSLLLIQIFWKKAEDAGVILKVNSPRPRPVKCIKGNVEYLKGSYFCLYNSQRTKFFKVLNFFSLGGLALVICEGFYTSNIHMATFRDVLLPLLFSQLFYTRYMSINLSFCDPCELWNTLLKFIIILHSVCYIYSNCPRWKWILTCHFVKLCDIWYFNIKKQFERII